MRPGLVVALIAVVLALGPSSSAGVFPDLPGADMLEESIADKAPDSATTSGNATEPSDDRVPAPDPSAVTKEAAGAQDVKTVTSLPGGGGLPILKDMGRTAERNSSTAPLVILAALTVLAFTRFLFRLNDLGRRPV